MVRINRYQNILNSNKLKDVFKEKPFIDMCEIKTKFADNCDLVLKRNDDHFLKNIQENILKMSEKIPHTQIVLNIKIQNNVMNVILNPVTGTA